MRKFVVLGVSLLGLVAVGAGCAETEIKNEPAEQTASAKPTLANDQAAEPKPEPKPEIARVGDTVEVGPVEVTVQDTVDPIVPAEDPYIGAIDEPSADHFVGVAIKVTNTSDQPFDPSIEGTPALVMANDMPAEEAIMVDTKPWAHSVSSDAKIAPGASLVLHLPFDAPTGRPGRFQYSVYTPDFDEVVGEWKLG
jgi:hypothetical protein